MEEGRERFRFRAEPLTDEKQPPDVVLRRGGTRSLGSILSNILAESSKLHVYCHGSTFDRLIASNQLMQFRKLNLIDQTIPEVSNCSDGCSESIENA